jgi:hypothetical protein
MLDVVASAGKVVLYGKSLQTYGCIVKVMAAGVPAGSISLVTPSTPACFNSSEVEAKVKAYLKGVGVNLYSGYNLARAEGNADGRLVSAMFETEAGKTVGMSCDVLACYSEPNVDLDVAKALNENALVYDGRLVINSCFQTNDPNILAAGSLTKFSRKYGKQMPLQYFNSREVGEHLGRTLLDFAMNDGANLDTATVPTLCKAKAKATELPGNMHYFHASLPENPATTAIAGRDLATGEETLGNGYCSVHVNAFDVITGITYLGKQELEWSNLVRVVGLPQGYANRLLLHYDEGVIKDLTDWFRQPWAVRFFTRRATAHMQYGQHIRRSSWTFSDPLLHRWRCTTTGSWSCKMRSALKWRGDSRTLPLSKPNWPSGVLIGSPTEVSPEHN